MVLGIGPRWLALLALSGMTSGCGGEDFPPAGRLTSLRVLGVQSEPVAPAASEVTTLTPLVYVPPDQNAPEYQWSWCPLPGAADDGYPCLLDAETLKSQFEGLDVPSTDLGTDETATFENPLDATLFAALCSGQIEGTESLDCSAGLPIQIKLTVSNDDETVDAVRTLYLRVDDSIAPNQNPSFDGLEVQLGGTWLTVNENFDSLVPRDEPAQIRTNITEDEAESYETLDASGQTNPAREQLNIAWFVESGSTKSEHTSYIEDKISIDKLRSNEWSPGRSEDYSRATSELILVLHDDREGISWQRFSVGLTEKP